ncbi:MAG: hypothetical protein H6620_10500 [Halobacteriovoraceae bacterium]|nr:hypothetical protein [Halobacteriovoraceae bacterium]
MGQKLPEDQMALYRRVDEVLHYIWDPIGISDCAYARDEYYSYIPSIFNLVISGKSENEIMEKLHIFSTQNMGFSDTEEGKKHCLKVAKILLEHREYYEQNKIEKGK